MAEGRRIPDPAERAIFGVHLLTALLCAPPLFAAAPFAHTQAAAPISTTNATLNGMVVPNGLSTVAWFEWGNNGGYVQQTVSTNVGAGQGVVWISLPVAFLSTTST